MENHFISPSISHSQFGKRGIGEEQLKDIRKYGGYKAWLSQQNIKLPDLDEKTWFLPHANRAEAEQLLSGMPTGTFLIRAGSIGGNALSITCDDCTSHCIINHTETGFGFAEPFNIFESLLALVKHYSKNSLEEHNDVLHTTLRYPVMGTYILNLKEQQQQKQDDSSGDKNKSKSNSGVTESTPLNAASAQNNLGIPYPAFAPN